GEPRSPALSRDDGHRSYRRGPGGSGAGGARGRLALYAALRADGRERAPIPGLEAGNQGTNRAGRRRSRRLRRRLHRGPRSSRRGPQPRRSHPDRLVLSRGGDGTRPQPGSRKSSMIPTEATASAPPIVDLRELRKTYALGETAIQVLCDVNLRIGAGEVVSLTGPSGSGKSTLLNILGCLDRPTAGQYLFDGIETTSFSEDQRAGLRS